MIQKLRKFFTTKNTLDESKLPHGFLLSMSTFLIIIAALFLSIFSEKHLSADGVHYFDIILGNKDFTYIDWTRQFSNYISQSLFVLAVNFTNFDFHSLSPIFGISILLQFFVTFAISIFAQRGEDKSLLIFVLLSMISINLSSDFILVGEHHSLTLLSWPILLLLLRRKPSTHLDRFLLLVLMGLYTCLYSTAVIPASIFIVLITLRIKHSESKCSKYYHYLLLALASVAVYVSLNSILFPRDPGNKSGFFTAVFQTLIVPEVIVSILFIGLFFLAWALKHKKLLHLSLIPVTIFALFVIISDYTISAGHSFNNRTLVVTLLPLLLAMACFVHWKKLKASKSIYRAFLIFSVVMVVNNTINTFSWRSFRHDFRETLHRNSGLIQVENTPIYTSSYRWGWTTPELSLIFSEGEVKTIILNSKDTGWQPDGPPHTFILKSYIKYSPELLKTGIPPNPKTKIQD